MEPSKKTDLIQAAKDIAAGLPSLPPAPSDLPKPWNYKRWIRILLLAYFASIFVLWYIGRALEMAFLGTFDGACVANFLFYSFISVYVLNRFLHRGYDAHYGFFFNRTLYRARRKYRKRKLWEVYFDFFAQYLVGERDVYLVWYLPGGDMNSTRNLVRGAEPLLFTRDGQWIDDEDLFHKVVLMWSNAQDFCPATLTRKLLHDYKTFQRITNINFPRLPGWLETFEADLKEVGLEEQLRTVREAFPAKYALCLHTIDIMEKKIEWAEAHGWHSLNQLRYADMLPYHEAYEAISEAQRKLKANSDIEKAQEAANEMLEVIEAHRKLFPRSESVRLLSTALSVFGAQLQPIETEFLKKNGVWQVPDIMLDAYRSRLAYAREVDQKLQEKAAKKKDR